MTAAEHQTRLDAITKVDEIDIEKDLTEIYLHWFGSHFSGQTIDLEPNLDPGVMPEYRAVEFPTAKFGFGVAPMPKAAKGKTDKPSLDPFIHTQFQEVRNAKCAGVNRSKITYTISHYVRVAARGATKNQHEELARRVAGLIQQMYKRNPWHQLIGKGLTRKIHTRGPQPLSIEGVATRLLTYRVDVSFDDVKGCNN